MSPLLKCPPHIVTTGLTNAALAHVSRSMWRDPRPRIDSNPNLAAASSAHSSPRAVTFRSQNHACAESVQKLSSKDHWMGSSMAGAPN